MTEMVLLLKYLTISMFVVTNGHRLPSALVQLKTPSNFTLRNVLINYITEKPEIEVLKFNKEDILIRIPQMYFQSFLNLGISINEVHLLERKLLSGSYNNSSDYFSNMDKDKKDSKRIKVDNGVRQLMERSTKQNVRINFNERPPYIKIKYYLRKLAKRHPEKIKLKRIGKTAENQYIFIVILHGNNGILNNGVFLDAGIYGNDWLSVMVVLYVIEELVENSHSYPELENLTWFIIPVVNPDGYRYSHQHPEQPWLKNRNQSVPCWTGTYGVNLFRNFPWNFKGKGSSKYACSLFYAGLSPFSEIESTVLGQALIRNVDYIKLYLGIQGSGNSILYPWSYSYTPCDEYKDLESLAIVTAQAMNNASRNPHVKYTIGSYGATTFPSAGSPLDYAKRHLHIKYSFILQMKDRHISGSKSTDSEVFPIILETFTGIKTMALYVSNHFLLQKFNLRLFRDKRKHTITNKARCNIRNTVLIICCLITYL